MDGRWRGGDGLVDAAFLQIYLVAVEPSGIYGEPGVDYERVVVSFFLGMDLKVIDVAVWQSCAVQSITLFGLWGYSGANRGGGVLVGHRFDYRYYGESDSSVLGESTNQRINESTNGSVQRVWVVGFCLFVYSSICFTFQESRRLSCGGRCILHADVWVCRWVKQCVGFWPELVRWVAGEFHESACNHWKCYLGW